MNRNRTVVAALVLLAAGCATPAPEARQPPRDASQTSVRWQPYDTRPVVVNREECDSVQEREYTPALRNAGIEGEATVYVRLDVEGIVRDVRIHKSSGHSELDEIALRVAGCRRFRPALHRGVPVPVWIQLPFAFRAR